MDSSNLEHTILHLLQSRPAGILSEDLPRFPELRGIETSVQVEALNSLLSKGRVTLFQVAKGKILYKEVSEDVAQKFHGLKPEELLIYRLIEQSGNQGIWTKHIRTRSNLPLTQVRKILKTLESRELVKNVTSVEAKTRKVYMLFDLEPSRDLTGGPWYRGPEFDVPFVADLLERCFEFVSAHDDACVADVSAYLKESGQSKTVFSDSDVRLVLDVLVYDGRLERLETGSAIEGKEHSYHCRRWKMRPEDIGWHDVPCIMCPHRMECLSVVRDISMVSTSLTAPSTNVISPQTCPYLTEWLS